MKKILLFILIALFSVQISYADSFFTKEHIMNYETQATFPTGASLKSLCGRRDIEWFVCVRNGSGMFHEFYIRYKGKYYNTSLGYGREGFAHPMEARGFTKLGESKIGKYRKLLKQGNSNGVTGYDKFYRYNPGIWTSNCFTNSAKVTDVQTDWIIGD